MCSEGSLLTHSVCIVAVGLSAIADRRLSLTDLEAMRVGTKTERAVSRRPY